jgi:hypothetical protein
LSLYVPEEPATMSTLKSSQRYVKFLHLAKAIRVASALPQLDSVEERLLNIFAAAWHADQRILVSEAHLLVPDCSERTVYRRLKTLAEKDLIMFGKDARDQRLRYVLPTDKTNQYFSQLGRCMELAYT